LISIQSNKYFSKYNNLFNYYTVVSVKYIAVCNGIRQRNYASHKKHVYSCSGSAREKVNLVLFILPNQVSKLNYHDKFICSYLYPLLIKGNLGLIIDPKKGH